MSTKYVQNQATTLAGAGAVIGATSITLSSFTDIAGAVLTMTDFGDIGYVTIEPNTSNEEAITFTGISQNGNGTATLTGVSNQLLVSPYTQVSGLAKTHTGGAIFVITNTAGYYDGFTNKNNDEIITGAWQVPTGGGGQQIANADDIANAISRFTGTASTTAAGTLKISVTPVSPSDPIAVGDNDPRLSKPVSGVLISRVLSASNETVATPHGLGRTPTFVEMNAVYIASDSTVPADMPLTSYGFYDGTNSRNIATGIGGGGTSIPIGTAVFAYFQITTSDFVIGAVTVDATNINITWTKTGSPTGTADIILKAY